MERLVQIAVILGKATEDAGNIFHNTTVCRIYFVDYSWDSYDYRITRNMKNIDSFGNGKKTTYLSARI